ncbi:MAG: trypsin-like peptidase domain-containing protein [Patescibacteria group bacterium]|jgi:serine protease Do
MDIVSFKSHLPAFIAGALGAFVCLFVFAGMSFAVVLFSPLHNEIENRFRAIVDYFVSEKNLTDSAGNHSDVVNVVDSASPAVVSIVITKDVPKLEQIIGDGSNNPFGFFGFSMPQYRQNGTEKKEIGGGSGFLVSDDGYIVTNAHVVSEKDAEYTVYLNDESEYSATVVSADSALDIAVLKIDASNLSYLEFGDSDAVKVGQSVVAIGNALGEFRNTVSVGVISGLSRSIVASGGGSSEVLSDVLQTDAAINPGNSGGPLLDLAGNVIGVNVATSSGGENVSFSLPSNAVKSAVDSIRTTGHVVRAYLGVRFVMLSESMANANNLSVTDGALIRRGANVADLAVVPGSPADKAGIEENDIVTKIDNIVLDEEHPLDVVLRKSAVGDTVMLTIIHDGKEGVVSVTLEEWSTEAEK